MRTLRQAPIECGVTTAVRDYWDGHTLGLQFVNDPTLVVGSPEFFDHVRPWMSPFRFPEIMPRIERNDKELKGKHLLEVGCGLGFEGLEYMKRGVRVTATDLTPSAVELARRHFEIAGFRPEDVLVADVLDLPFADQTFDAVSATGVLHHTGDTPRAVREIHRVLKPGGKLAVLEITRPRGFLRPFFRLWFDVLVPLAGRIIPGGQAYTYLPASVRRFPGPDDLSAIFERAGFEDVRFRLLGGGIVALHVGTRP